MILVTGSAGFIGFAVTKKLLTLGYNVVGYDNLNNYYDVNLKKNRIKTLIKIAKKNKVRFYFEKKDLKDQKNVNSCFKKYKIKKVIHLAAQAGVRYSLKNPHSYVTSNITGFLNILEACRSFKVKHLIFASTSSVYGNSKKIPFKESDLSINPIQFYSSTKKSNEIMAYSYSYLFKLPCTGIRIFTAYGPWGRPDMAMFKFVKNITANKPIDVFNYGNHRRDFTYVSDIAEYIFRLLNKKPRSHDDNKIPFCILNLGNGKLTTLKKVINLIEQNLNKKAQIKYKKLQPGDVVETLANNKKVTKITGYKPKISIEIGIRNFINWYRNYYK